MSFDSLYLSRHWSVSSKLSKLWTQSYFIGFLSYFFNIHRIRNNPSFISYFVNLCPPSSCLPFSLPSFTCLCLSCHFIDIFKGPAFGFIDFLCYLPVFNFIDFCYTFYYFFSLATLDMIYLIFQVSSDENLDN